VQCKTENPETLATLGTHDKGQRQKNIKKNPKTKKNKLINKQTNNKNKQTNKHRKQIKVKKKATQKT
jgi:hypothetical protein